MNNEEQVKQEYPKCIYCGAPTMMVAIRDSQGGHDALVCTKCNRFQDNVPNDEKEEN